MASRHLLLASLLLVLAACPADSGVEDAGADAAGDLTPDTFVDLKLPLDAGKPCAPAVWTPVKAGTTSFLRGIWGTGPADIFAVGYSGTVIHYDGSTWSQVPQTLFSRMLTDVWSAGPTSEVLVVGSDGVLLRHDRTTKSWSKELVDARGSGVLNGIWGAGGELFAPGWHGISDNLQPRWVIHHQDGTQWNEVFKPAAGEYVWQRQMIGVWGTSATNVFVVGSSHLFHRTSAGWGDTFLNGKTFNAVHGTGASHAVAVGTGGEVYRYDGSTWTDVKPQGLGQTLLLGVWAGAKDEVYVVGNDGAAFLLDDTSFKPLCTGTRQRLWDVWGDGQGKVYAVGDGGTVLRYDEP